MMMKPLDLYLLGVLSLGLVFAGMFLLILITFLRRWQRVRFVHYGHQIQVHYRPMLATLMLSGVRSPAAIAALRKLPEADLDLLLDPLFAKRKLASQQRVFLRNICAELGLVNLWQSRIANGRGFKPSGNAALAQAKRPSAPPHLRAKALRNLGILAHQQSWAYLAHALDDPHPDIQLAGLRSLAALGGSNAFGVLRARIHALVLGERQTPPMPSLLAAMSRFELNCIPALLPSLNHSNRQIRLHAMEVLRTMASREAVRQPDFVLNEAALTPPVMELLFHRLPVDVSDEIRARASEVLVYLTDPRATLVLHNLLFDPQWFVRLRTLLSLANLRQGAAPLHPDIRVFLRDSQWQVREAAIQALISLRPEDRHELYRFYLGCEDRNIRNQIAEMLQRTGLMSRLVEDYSGGVRGLPALVVEELASHSAPAGLWGILQTTAPDIREKFMDRLLPFAHARMLSPEPVRPVMERVYQFQQPLEFPSFSAA